MVVIVEDITPAAMPRPHPSAPAPVRSGGAAACHGTDERGGRDTEEDEIDEALTLTNLKKLIKKQGGYASSLELNEVRKRGPHHQSRISFFRCAATSDKSGTDCIP